jgi:hypothetical protein
MKRCLAIPLAILLAALLSTSVAHSELTQSEGLRVAFDGGFSPSALPRNRPVPVTVQIDGSIGTVNGSQPPQLRQVSFAINRNGKLYSAGLPSCPIDLLQSTTSQAALARCRPALIGRGSFGADVDFPNLPLVPVHGRLLAFNGRSANGRPEILLHLYVSSPAQVTLVLAFKIIRQSTGVFGTVLAAQIPKIAGELGYVTEIDLKIGRRYRYRGLPRSLLSASCAAPAGFPGAIFNFAKGSFSFANGQRLTTTLTRDCRVRR